jgi:hypothetical protein
MANDAEGGLTRDRFPLVLTMVVVALLTATSAAGHNAVALNTGSRLSPTTVALLDPLQNPGPGGVGTDTHARNGDILTFRIRFSPVNNGATRAAGSYVTAYVPMNTQVVGVRFTDRDGNTVVPQLGGLMNDGYGPGARHNEFDALGLLQGSLSQLYADTGIFFSTDSRTARFPADDFLMLTNGIEIAPPPTAGGQVHTILGALGPPFYAHNEWDRIQAQAFGASAGSVGLDGRGNTPYGFGSPVAGPDTHYAFDKVPTPACSDTLDNDTDGSSDFPNDPECASALDDDETSGASAPVGPWKRIQSVGSQLGTGAPTDCSDCAGTPVRTGVPIASGWAPSPDNPLPLSTQALRFAVGETSVGMEYFAEISLLVNGLPLDPVMGADVFCSEVFAGDAAMPQNGRDNPWRYSVPSPDCVRLNLVHELSVDRLSVLQGGTLTYSLHGRYRLSVRQQYRPL